MARFDVILMDADRTLFDFDRGEQAALETVMAGLGRRVAPDALARYRRINDELWSAVERGELETGALSPVRFARFLSEEGVGADPDAVSDRYIDELGRQAWLMPGAVRVCARLAKMYRLYVVTNGFERVQRARMAKSAVRPYFADVFVSQEIGAAKPEPAFYDEVLRRAGVSDRSRVLAVGDSASADVAGANRAGIAACYLSPAGAPLPAGVSAEFTVKSLDGLTAFL